MTKTLTIYRYANRKLYCAEEKYTTLAWIRERILEGRAIRVLCHVTGADVTASIIARIITVDAAFGQVAPGMLISLLQMYARHVHA